MSPSGGWPPERSPKALKTVAAMGFCRLLVETPSDSRQAATVTEAFVMVGLVGLVELKRVVVLGMGKVEVVGVRLGQEAVEERQREGAGVELQTMAVKVAGGGGGRRRAQRQQQRQEQQRHQQQQQERQGLLP